MKEDDFLFVVWNRTLFFLIILGICAFVGFILIVTSFMLLMKRQDRKNFQPFLRLLKTEHPLLGVFYATQLPRSSTRFEDSKAFSVIIATLFLIAQILVAATVIALPFIEFSSHTNSPGELVVCEVGSGAFLSFYVIWLLRLLMRGGYQRTVIVHNVNDVTSNNDVAVPKNTSRRGFGLGLTIMLDIACPIALIMFFSVKHHIVGIVIWKTIISLAFVWILLEPLRIYFESHFFYSEYAEVPELPKKLQEKTPLLLKKAPQIGAILGNDNNGSNSEPSTPRLASQAGKVTRYQLPPVDMSQTALENDVRGKWSRPFEQLAVAIDIPRLAKKIQVEKNDRILTAMLDVGLPKEEQDALLEQNNLRLLTSSLPSNTDVVQTIANIFVSLASAFEPNDVVTADQVREELQAPHPLLKVVDNQDSTIQAKLSLFLKQVLGSESRAVRVLKVCNQSIVAPAYLRLKSSLLPSKLLFKDVKFGWRIFIQVLDDEVRVSHVKREQSTTEGEFQFVWRFQITFDERLEDVRSVNLVIDEITFGSDVPFDRQEEVRSALTSFRIIPKDS